MDFLNPKIKDYLLGDTGGKVFPEGPCPNLRDFTREVLGPDVVLWPMQKLILKTVANAMGQFPYMPLTVWEQETLDELTSNVAKQNYDHTYRQAVVRTNPKSTSPMVVLLIIGRGGSKSFLMSLLVAYFIRWLLSHKSPHRYFSLAKTKPIAIQCLAGKESQAVSLFRSVKTHVRNCDGLKSSFDEFKESMNFGGVVEARAYTSNSNTVRGEDTFCYYHEETAFCSEDNPESEKSFTECYKAIQPAVKNRFGRLGVMLFATSAGMKIGKTYQIYRQILNGTIQNCVMFQMAVWEINPKYVNGKADFAQEYAEDPVTADAEHGSKFVDAVNVFLTPAEVQRPIKAHLKKQDQGQPGIQYWIRIDPSRKHDRYALCLGHKEYRRENGYERIVAVMDYITWWQARWFDRETGEERVSVSARDKQRLRCEPVNPQRILEHIEDLCLRFNVVGVSSDQFESQYIIDELNDRYGSEEFPFGFIHPITEKANWLAYRNLKKLINTDCLELYAEPSYIEEASVAMRYNKNKPLDTKPDELLPGGLDEWDDDEDEAKIDQPNLIYSVAAPTRGAVKTDDVLDAVTFCAWDMMVNPELGVADLRLLEAGVPEKKKAKPGEEEIPIRENLLEDIPEKW